MSDVLWQKYFGKTRQNAAKRGSGGFIPPGTMTETEFQSLLIDRELMGFCLICGETLTNMRLHTLCAGCVRREWT